MIGICERCHYKRVIRYLFYLENKAFKPINLCHDCETMNEGFIMVAVTNQGKRATRKRALVEKSRGKYYYLGGTNKGKVLMNV